MDKQRRIKELEQLIDQANTAYWIKQDPIIDDAHFDQLVEELKHLKPDSSLVSEIGDDSIPGQKVAHKQPMLSLDKCYSWNDLIRFCESVARSEDELFSFSCKYDGLSLEIVDGRLITRGNGKVGTDVTHLTPWIEAVYSFKGVPVMMRTLLKDPNFSKQRLVGELLIRHDRFDKLKNSYPMFADYKTPRNMASGFANLQPGSDLLTNLNYAGMDVIICDWVRHRAHELTYSLKDLRGREKEIVKKLRNYKKCPCDGIVCRLTDDEYGESLGVTQHHPKSAIALKFEDDKYESVVREIVWQTANEAITPVAVFDPIDIDGVEVERATCHNAKFVVDHHLTPGATVTIVRRGGVIPKIVDVVPITGAPIILPIECPSCGSKTVYEEPDLLCKNETCVGRCVSKIVNGLQTLGMKGIGPSLVERMVRELCIPDVMSWCMESFDKDILLKKGFTAHEIHMIMSEFDRVTDIGLDDATIFASLCIPMAAESFANKVIKYTGTIMSLVDAPTAVMTNLKDCPGLNSTALQNTIDFMVDHAGEFESYYNLFKHNVPIDVDNREKYCFTGALPFPRKDLEQWVVDHGAYPTDNIRQANYLVSASATSTSSKMLYARKHNIPVITFEEMQAHLSK